MSPDGRAPDEGGRVESPCDDCGSGIGRGWMVRTGTADDSYGESLTGLPVVEILCDECYAKR